MRVLGAVSGRLRECRGQSGVTLVETLVSLAILGTVSVAFLGGLGTTSRAAIGSDSYSTAENLAQVQMETVRRVAYVYEASDYPAAPLPAGDDYSVYSVTITAEPLNSPDDGIQRITVTVSRAGGADYRLVSYKADR